MFSLRKQKWFIKLSNWEYWPFHIVYFPIYFYWVFLSIKARSFLFFSAANPAIESGGMLGESKDRILQQLPELYKPLSILIGRNDVFATILIKMKNSDIHYPIIAKPDIGERGWKVQKITSDVELMAYAENAEFNFLIINS